jgi:hypothetical protein
MTKRILDEETRRKLLGSLPFSSSVTIDCTLVISDLPDFNPIFTVRSFTQQDVAQLKANGQSFGPNATTAEISDVADKNLEVSRACISGWKNLIDIGTGEEVDFVGSASAGCDKAVYSNLPRWMRGELFSFIKKISSISTPEELSIK